MIAESRISNEQMVSMVRNELYAMRDNLFTRLLDGKRDIDRECGYHDMYALTPNLYRYMYEREGIPARIVNIYPDKCWSVDPEIFEDPDEKERTSFEEAWEKLAKDNKIYHYLHRLDRLAGIGHYGILLMGIDDGLPLSAPVEGINEDGELQDGFTPPERKLLFMRPFDESMLMIHSYQLDMNSPRYGHPLMYNVKMWDPTVTIIQGAPQPGGQQLVHWSRVLHFADNCMSSEVFGVPRQQQVWNRLYDTRKILAGSGEMFWKGAFPGYALELDPALAGEVDFDAASIRKAFEEYQNGLQRYISTIGISVKSLAPQMGNPKEHMETQINAICISIDCPKSIFMGSDQGETASTKDQKAWKLNISKRQKSVLTPLMLNPLIKRLGQFGVLEVPEEHDIHWPDANTSDDDALANTALKKTQAISAYVSGGGDAVIPPLEYLTTVLHYTQQEALKIVEAAEKHASDGDILMQVVQPPQPAALPGGDPAKPGQQQIGPRSAGPKPVTKTDKSGTPRANAKPPAKSKGKAK